MFGNIPRNAECLATFPGMFRNISPITRVPRILLPIPVFMVLLIASGRLLLWGCFCAFLISEPSIYWSEIYMYCRSRHRMWSIKIGVLKNFAKLTEKHLHWSVFFNQVAGVSFLIKLQASGWNYIKKRLQHRCFPLNFAKFLKTLFLQNTNFWKPLVTDAFQNFLFWFGIFFQSFFIFFNKMNWLSDFLIIKANDNSSFAGRNNNAF